MTQIKIRPRLKITTEMSPETILSTLRKHLADPDAPCTGTVANNYVILSIPEKDSHFWSPRLTIEMREENGRTTLSGLFGPRPMVWTLFAGFYLSSIFLAFVGLMWGGAQWSLGMKPYAFWLLAFGVIALIISYGSALIGQKLGKDQMHILHDFLNGALNLSKK